MAYHGLLPQAKQFLFNLDHPPAFLEIGVDRGVSFLTIVTFLVRTKQEFFACGIDVMVQDAVQIMLANIDCQEKQVSYLVQDNSLVVLPKMVEQGAKFDLVFIDGDHNYHTVKSELSYLNELTHHHSMVIIDDYDGRWAERDLWYAERPGYEDNKLVSTKVDTEKHGVKSAVDEWLSTNSDWKLSKPVNGEPVVLTRSGK